MFRNEGRDLNTGSTGTPVYWTCSEHCRHFTCLSVVCDDVT